MTEYKTKRFVMGPVEMIPDRSISSTAIRVYLALRSYRNEKTRNPVYPSRKTIASQACCSLDTVDRSIKSLIELGYISRTKGKRGFSNTYQFNDDGSRTGAARVAARERLPYSTDAHAVAAPTQLQSESGNQKQEPGSSHRLFHGNDRAWVGEDGAIRIKNHRGTWVDYGGGDEDAFRFGNLRGAEARKAAIAQVTGAGVKAIKTDIVSPLPTSAEDIESSRSQRPSFDNLTND